MSDHLELFLESMHKHFKFNELTETSKKEGIRLRLIFSGGHNYRIYPHFMFSYMPEKITDISDALTLSRWTPYWALAEIFGRNAMYW